MASSAWVCRFGMYSRCSSRRRPRQMSTASSATRVPYSATAAMDMLTATALDQRQVSVARPQLQLSARGVHERPASLNCAKGLRKAA